MICTNCNSDIPDGYRFCLQCGRGIEEPPPTVKWNAPLVDTTPTNRTTAEQLQSKSRISAWMLLLYMICGALSIFGGLVLYNLYQSKNPSQQAQPSVQESNQNNNSAKANTEVRTVVTSSSPAPVQKPAPSPSSSPQIASASSSERIWYVMLGGYREQNWAAAETRRDHLQQQGFNAYIVDTNNYQNFDPNLHAVVMGPYSKDEATDVAERVRSIRPDVYVKWARLLR